MPLRLCKNNTWVKSPPALQMEFHPDWYEYVADCNNSNIETMASTVKNFGKELLHAGKGEVPSFPKNSKVSHCMSINKICK